MTGIGSRKSGGKTPRAKTQRREGELLSLSPLCAFAPLRETLLLSIFYLLSAILAPPIPAQDIFTTRSGRTIEGHMLRVTEEKVFLEISLEKDGPKGETSIAISEMVKAQLTKPPALEKAFALFSKGDAKGTIQQVDPVMKYHLPLIGVPETWVADAALLLAEAL